MFWAQCDKIVTSDGPVKCDFCPYPKYIYVTRNMCFTEIT